MKKGFVKKELRQVRMPTILMAIYYLLGQRGAQREAEKKMDE